ncbi:hypothetical protein EYF80_007768 [Liparis tanakae]|uniref:Uncharacterized protein n=1 Tax=Liparis tanakae TaxID=230148 RepID=A0A4Z2IXV8_9TELE|nr:hypothetical protein EYF80_007768 [Liparis tanakae]
MYNHCNAPIEALTAWENASTGNNTAYDNIQPRQRSSPNTGCSTKASPDLNEGPTPTYLIGSSSFLTEIPVAEGGQRMLLAYRLCTRASSEECSNIGALEKSARTVSATGVTSSTGSQNALIYQHVKSTRKGSV